MFNLPIGNIKWQHLLQEIVALLVALNSIGMVAYYLDRIVLKNHAVNHFYEMTWKSQIVLP